MPYSFDQPIDRLHSDSTKWHVYGPDVLPLWTADMDFRVPEPVVAALRAGATDIVALDLLDTREHMGRNRLTGILEKVSMVVEKRQADLELELARARGVATLYIDLVGKIPFPIWDFKHPDEMIEDGYDIALRLLDEHSEVIMKMRESEV